MSSVLFSELNWAQQRRKTASSSSVQASRVRPRTGQMKRGSTTTATQTRRGPASDPNAPIEVRGQSRNLNMLLILQNPNEEINFVKPRTDYKKEIDSMTY